MQDLDNAGCCPEVLLSEDNSKSVSEEHFDCQQVNTIFVQMCTESMAQGMTGNTLLPSEGALYFVNVAG